MATMHSEDRVGGRGANGAAAPHSVSRRAALSMAVGAVSALVSDPRPALADEAPGASVETMETSAEFNGPYTAWAGYASTARHSVAAGAVPVKAPASPEVAWTSGLDAPAGALVLRQSGQSTFLYALAGGSIERYDAATGDPLGSVALPARPCAGAQPVFAESTLVVALEDGRVAVFDEALAPAWTSEAPSLPAGASSWGAGGPVASMGGAVHVALAALDASGAACGVEVLSLAGIDGSLFWRASLPAGAASPAPRLMAAGGALLLHDGGPTIRLIDIESGGVLDELEFVGAVEGRVAELPAYGADGPAWVVGDASGTVSVVVAAGGSLEVIAESPLAAVDGVPWRLLPLPPAVARGHAFFWARADGADAVGAACLDVALAEIGAIEAGSPVGGEALLPAEAPLAVVRGVGAREARVTLYALAESGALAAIELPAGEPGGGEGAAEVLWSPSGARPSAAPLVDRDGALFVATAPGNGSAGGLITAFAPDGSRAVGTPVGGSEGFDTLGSRLSGLTLPNGAGLGAGALFLAATFGAYALIRNRGGRGRRDEGVDAWRAEHGRGGDDEDGMRRDVRGRM